MGRSSSVVARHWSFAEAVATLTRLQAEIAGQRHGGGGEDDGMLTGETAVRASTRPWESA